MIRKKLLIALFFLILVSSVLNNALRLGKVDVSAVPLSPFIMIIPEQTQNYTITPGMNYTIQLYTDYTGNDVQGWQFELTFNPAVFEGIAVTNGNLITTANHSSAQFIPGAFDNNLGKLGITTGFFLPFSIPPATTSGPGTLAYVTFEVIGTGISNITLGQDTTLLQGYNEAPPFGGFYNIIDSSQPPGAAAPPYGVDHVGHSSFDNIAPIHDAAVTDVTAPASAILGVNVTIDVTVANEGNFTETFDVTVEANSTQIGTQTVTNMTSANSTTLSFVWNTAGATAGNYTLNATLSLTDDDMSDNNRTATIEIIEVHDVAVTTLEAPDDAIVGDIVPINVTVANHGSFDENINLTVTYESQIAGQELPSDTVLFPLAKLPASQTVQVNWNTSGVLKGGYKINATVIIPQDENINDNNKTRIISLALGHDLAVTASASPLALFAGENATISVTVRNEGGFNETNVEVKASYDSTLIGSQQILSLPEGNSTTLTFNWNTAGITPKVYVLRAEALLDTDANPTNNQRLLFITVLTPTGHIAGTVRDTSGNPIQGATVTANGHSDTTDANGQYNITSIPVGTYTVTASKTGYYTKSQTNVAVAAKQTTSLNFTLTTMPTTGHIAGTVSDAATANPIQGANVTANGHYDITDANGEYNITNLPAGTYTVSVSKNGYETTSHTDITVTAGQTITVNLEMTPTQTQDIMPYIIAAAAIAALIGITAVALFLRKTKRKRSNENTTIT